MNRASSAGTNGAIERERSRVSRSCQIGCRLFKRPRMSRRNEFPMSALRPDSLIRFEKKFHVRRREYLRPHIPPLSHHRSTLSNLPLDRQQPGPNRWNCRNHRGRRRHRRRSEVAAHISAIDEHCRGPLMELHLEREGGQQSGNCFDISRIPSRLNDGPSHRAIEGARVEIQIPQSRGQQFGHCTLADTGWTINRNGQPSRLLFLRNMSHVVAPYYSRHRLSVNNSNSV